MSPTLTNYRGYYKGWQLPFNICRQTYEYIYQHLFLFFLCVYMNMNCYFMENLYMFIFWLLSANQHHLFTGLLYFSVFQSSVYSSILKNGILFVSQTAIWYFLGIYSISSILLYFHLWLTFLKVWHFSVKYFVNYLWIGVCWVI